MLTWFPRRPVEIRAGLLPREDLPHDLPDPSTAPTVAGRGLCANVPRQM